MREKTNNSDSWGIRDPVTRLYRFPGPENPPLHHKSKKILQNEPPHESLAPKIAITKHKNIQALPTQGITVPLELNNERDERTNDNGTRQPAPELGRADIATKSK